MTLATMFISERQWQQCKHDKQPQTRGSIKNQDASKLSPPLPQHKSVHNNCW